MKLDVCIDFPSFIKFAVIVLIFVLTIFFIEFCHFIDIELILIKP